MWKKRSYPTCVFGKGVSDFVLHLSAGVTNDEIGTRSKEASLKFRELDCITPVFLFGNSNRGLRSNWRKASALCIITKG